MSETINQKKDSATKSIPEVSVPDQSGDMSAEGAFGSASSKTVQRARLDPYSLRPQEVLALQRTIGNRAVARLFSSDKPITAQEILEADRPNYSKFLSRLAKTPDMEAIVQTLASTPNGKRRLKGMVLSLGYFSGSAETRVGNLAIQEAFGIEKVEGFEGHGLSKMWPALEKVPAPQLRTATNTSLKALVRNGKWFNSGDYDKHKSANIQYGGITAGFTIGATEKLTSKVGMPFIGATAMSGGSTIKRANVFTHTVLHEIGHSVDDKLNIMNKYGKEPIFGGWEEYQAGAPVGEMIKQNEAVGLPPNVKKENLKACIEAIIGGGTVKDFISEKVADINRTRRNARRQFGNTPQTANLGSNEINTALEGLRSTPAVKMAKLGGNKFALSGAKGAWQLPIATLANAAVNGRVFHKAYAGTAAGADRTPDRWVSYNLASRVHEISAYQWRAPGEWFAEIYAAFYENALDKAHPIYGWFKEFVDKNKDMSPAAVKNPSEWKSEQEQATQPQPLPPQQVQQVVDAPVLPEGAGVQQEQPEVKPQVEQIQPQPLPPSQPTQQGSTE